MTVRISQNEIREIMSAATNAKTGKVMYPVRTFDGDLLDSIAHDLHDHHEIDSRLTTAIAHAEQQGMVEIARTLRWVRTGDTNDQTA